MKRGSVLQRRAPGGSGRVDVDQDELANGLAAMSGGHGVLRQLDGEPSRPPGERNYEPDLVDERPVDEYLLERAALARARGERQIVDAVTAARAKGIPWQRIGELLGTSAQAAQQRYGAVIETS